MKDRFVLARFFRPVAGAAVGTCLLVLAAVHAAPAATAEQVKGPSRGYLTTPQELAEIKRKADLGIEPYRSAVSAVVAYAQGGFLTKASGTVDCKASATPQYLAHGAPLAYACALAYQLTGDVRYAAKAKGGIQGLYAITGLQAGGDCPLTMGRLMPAWICAADLIEDYWSKSEKREFQNWLAALVYPTLLTKYARGNNWGAVITNAGQYVADYCWDRPELKLGGETPAAAYIRMRQAALDRMNGLIFDTCGEGVSMIRPDGGIPEELRRTTTCDETKLTANSSAHGYTEGWLSGAIGQAELCLRRGDNALYENLMTTAGQTPGGKVLPAGRGSIKKAINFVIQTNALRWEKKQTLMIAARYYRDPAMLAQARDGRPFGANTSEYVNYFTTLTHDFAEGEDPGPPPVVSPPKD